jgi:hypothetical protein
MLSAYEQHVDDLSSTSQNTLGKKKSRVKFPCSLWGGSHQTHLFPHVDKASKLLEDMTVSHPHLPTAYCKLTLNPPVVDGMINLVPSLVNLVDHVVDLVTSLVEVVEKVVHLLPSLINPTLPPESENQVVDPISSSVDLTLPFESQTQAVDSFPPIDPTLLPESETQVINLTSLSVDPTLLLESKPNTAHVFLVDTKSTVSGGIPPSPREPPPSNESIIFNWGVLTRPRLPSHIPFYITTRVCGRDVPQTLIDENVSISILSSIAWQALGCPQLASITQNMLDFNRRTSQPLGTLPQFPVTLGGKTVFIDVMVVQDPLDFSLLLGWDYVYAMKSIVSTLFCVIYFPHDGRIVNIDQLSFIVPDWITSLNGLYMQTVSPLPQVNYVALYHVLSTVDVGESLTVFSISYELDSVVDMVISSIGLLEQDLLTPIVTLDMCSFQSVFLPSNEDLLEGMTEFCLLTWCPSRALSSWKP